MLQRGVIVRLGQAGLDHLAGRALLAWSNGERVEQDVPAMEHELREDFNRANAQEPKGTFSTWHSAIMNGETTLGYIDWLDAQS